MSLRLGDFAKFALAFLAICELAGCATTQTVMVRSDPSCHLIKPRTYDRDNDTDQSIEYRRDDNAAACTCSNWKNTPQCKAAK
jgi:hypothetical protein